MKLKCYGCNHEWPYKGQGTIYVSCPSCKKSVKKSYAQRYHDQEGKCENCKSQENIEFHHHKPRQQGIDDSYDNMRVLCRDCHQKIPKSSRLKKDRKLIQVNITFEDEEHEYLSTIKESQNVDNWRKFILNLTGYKKTEEKQ